MVSVSKSVMEKVRALQAQAKDKREPLLVVGLMLAYVPPDNVTTSKSWWSIAISLGPLQLSIALVIAIGNSNSDKGSRCFLYPDHSPLVVAMTNALAMAITFCSCDDYRY